MTLLRPPAAALLPAETVHYRVTHGLLGTVAEATLTLKPLPAQGHLRATGEGQGDLMGFGKMRRRFESEFDPKTLASVRWVVTRPSACG